MKGRIRFFAILALLLPAAAQTGARAEAPSPGSIFSIVESREDGWTVAVRTAGSPSTYVSVDGATHILFARQSASLDERTGWPQIPYELLSLGIPPGASVSASLVDPVYETYENQDVAPVPSVTYDDQNEAVLAYRKDPAAYRLNQFLPSEVVQVEPPFSLRSQRIATVRLAPYQYNPARRTMKRLVSGRLEVRLTGGGSQINSPPGVSVPDPHFEGVYRSLLENYDQARGWRMSPRSGARAQEDSSRMWFEPGETYYRIRVAEDGWYRITPSDLQSVGTGFALIDTSRLRIYNRGYLVPTLFRPDSSIEFYGRRNRGDSTYLDYFTDTSTYWLTWEGAESENLFRDVPDQGPGSGSLVKSSPTRLHLEQNTDYYEGTGFREVSENGPVAGEGWVWDYYYPNSVYDYPFEIDHLDTTGGVQARLRVRLFSTTLNYNDPDHIARFWLNDSLLGEVGFTGRTGVTFENDLPAGLLREGNNTLRIMSVPTPSSPNQFYLDWFDLEYPRLHVATANQLLVEPVAQGRADPVPIYAGGFTSPLIEVFDLAGGRRILGGSVSGDSISGYGITFADSLEVSRAYAIVAEGGARDILPPEAKVFTDIRVQTTGADYIIVAHRDFYTSAARLAAHRHTTNGVRTVLVDVQEIYDEFNYGYLHTDAIKAYLRFAYENWPLPAPVYVMLFGDASWDLHGYKSTSIKKNFVPAYGVPAGDNWYVAFDSTYSFLPSMLIGRMPAENPVQAERFVDKLVGYDAYLLEEWNKNFLFITGGVTPSEQASFNGLSELIIGEHVDPAPVGGTSLRIYKDTPDHVDGENKQIMRDYFKDGLIFVNFLGHSGGRIWGVDVGDPNTLENTNGKLPFISSVSCNVGSFAEPASNVLSEDFVLADNRGAIAMWASSSLGYANVGAQLVDYFLDFVADTARGLGALTTAARIRLWQARGSDYVTVASVNLNPLVGDPLTNLAIPAIPDLAIEAEDISTNASGVSAEDTSLVVRLRLHNYGLVPADSVTVRLTERYMGAERTVLDDLKFPPVLHLDSLEVRWDAIDEKGIHTLTSVLDPGGLIEEVEEANNSASVDEYIFSTDVMVLRPLDNLVVSPGRNRLIVAAPGNPDSATGHLEFELDTVDTFDSPAVVRSPQVTSGSVIGEWETPTLESGKLYFWRVRSVRPSGVSRWTVSSLSVEDDAPDLPEIRWRLFDRGQFARQTLLQTAATDSGVAIARSEPVRILARSLGYRASADKDYYSIIQVGAQTMIGIWWVRGNSFLVARVDAFTGEHEFQEFDVARRPELANDMMRYINATPYGDFLAVSVIFDGATNVNDTLRSALKGLGSVLVDSLEPGHSWVLLARKGYAGSGGTTREQWSRDGVALDSLVVPSYHSLGTGEVVSIPTPVPQSWSRFFWDRAYSPGETTIQSYLLGLRSDGGVDTLRKVGTDSLSISLEDLTPVTAADTGLASFALSSVLSTLNAEVTPRLREWQLEMEPPAELVPAVQSLDGLDPPIPRGVTVNLPITIFNFGYQASDSVTLVASVQTGTGSLHQLNSVRVGPLPVDSSRTEILPFTTANLSGRISIRVDLFPSPGRRDLIQENNTLLVPLEVETDVDAKVYLFADGVPLMSGDYVSGRPSILVRLPEQDDGGALPRTVLFYVDGELTGSTEAQLLRGLEAPQAEPDEDPTFTPDLSTGPHELSVAVVQQSVVGSPDTLRQSVVVQVESENRILQLLNYPNPFSTETEFTFVLTGAAVPEELRIRIYTVSGRKIQEIPVPPGEIQIGFNRVYWDGRDRDGDELANGTYFYQVESKSGGKVQTEIGKLSKVR